jgi:hypothetical protein
MLNSLWVEKSLLEIPLLCGKNSEGVQSPTGSKAAIHQPPKSGSKKPYRPTRNSSTGSITATSKSLILKPTVRTSSPSSTVSMSPTSTRPNKVVRLPQITIRLLTVPFPYGPGIQVGVQCSLFTPSGSLMNDERQINRVYVTQQTSLIYRSITTMIDFYHQVPLPIPSSIQ